jgi:hypothetical protein
MGEEKERQKSKRRRRRRRWSETGIGGKGERAEHERTIAR